MLSMASPGAAVGEVRDAPRTASATTWVAPRARPAVVVAGRRRALARARRVVGAIPVRRLFADLAGEGRARGLQMGGGVSTTWAVLQRMQCGVMDTLFGRRAVSRDHGIL